MKWFNILIRGKQSKGNHSKGNHEEQRVLPLKTVQYSNKKVIAVDGFYYSGSGAVVELLSEFENVTCSSDREVYPNNFKKTKTKEVNFFTNSYSILNLFDSFRKSELEQDLAIKRFIFYVHEAYNYENPMFYNDRFLIESESFLKKILDLDSRSIEILESNNFPYLYDGKNDLYNECNFVQGGANHKYMYYKFKKMTANEFSQIVADYIYTFFDAVVSDKILICDQLFSLSRDLQSKLNFFMNENPVKEICVWRDPRDQFVDAFAHDIDYLPRVIDEYIATYKRNIKKIHDVTPYRMSVRFEDLCTNYDKVLNRICDFLELDIKTHVNRKKVFDPSISVKNIGIYKAFFSSERMQDIERELSEYCFN